MLELSPELSVCGTLDGEVVSCDAAGAAALEELDDLK